MWIFSRIIPNALKLDAYYSLGNWALWAICAGFDITVAVMTAWAFSTRDWFWDTFGWAGIASVFLVTVLLVSVAFLLLALAVNKWQSRPGIIKGTEIRPGGGDVTGRGGRGGGVGNISGKNFHIHTGRGGLGGAPTGGRGGDGGTTGDVNGDGFTIVAGDGGDAGQWDGRGGKGSRSPYETAGLSTDMWTYGRGGAGGNADEYNRRMDILVQVRHEYMLAFPDTVLFIDAGIEQVPITWVNKRLEELGESWRVEMQDGGYRMPPLLLSGGSSEPKHHPP